MNGIAVDGLDCVTVRFSREMLSIWLAAINTAPVVVERQGRCYRLRFALVDYGDGTGAFNETVEEL